MAVQINGAASLRRGADGSLDDGISFSSECDHSAIVVRIAGLVENSDTWHARDCVYQAFDDGRITAFGKIRNALYHFAIRLAFGDQVAEAADAGPRQLVRLNTTDPQRITMATWLTPSCLGSSR